MHVLVHYSYIEIAKLVSAYLTLETVISSNFEFHSQSKPYIFVKFFIYKIIFLKNSNKILSFTFQLSNGTKLRYRHVFASYLFSFYKYILGLEAFHETTSIYIHFLVNWLKSKSSTQHYVNIC